LIPPVLCWMMEVTAPGWPYGYTFSNELLLINGLLTGAGLYLIRHRP
jgi:hypothetical protein